MSQAELDQIFRSSPAGAIPGGEATGTAILWPGTLCARVIAWFVRWFCWQGKVFNSAEGYLVNRITAFSAKAIKARVYKDKSWFDQKECIVIDYSKTSLVAKFIRDEIREVSPALYLGQVFVGHKRLCNFSVSFQYEPARKLWRRVLATACLLLLVLVAYLAIRLTRDVPVTYASEEDHFKYGSTGGERDAGIPLSIWKVLPEMFPEYLPGKGLQSLGFIYEPGKVLPVGVSQRNVQGIDRVFLNCAICHAGTVRGRPDDSRTIILGMPANTVDLQGFERFLFSCAMDERFTPERILLELNHRGFREDLLNRTLFRFAAINLMRERMLLLKQRFAFMEREPDCGPGRVDTFNPPKVLLNFPMDKISTNEWVGLCDFPSLWYQGKRKGMQLHWDGNNTSVEERNRSAAFGTGALAPTLDRESMKRTERWLYDQARPPRFLFPIDSALAVRGEPLYRQYCANCHGKNGTDFSGELVGKVTPIDLIKTDRHRLDSYSVELCASQNILYAAYPDERFQNFRKTFGYANQPLDGIWLRAPYLHNGSVPTLRDLLEPAPKRPRSFYRGYDVYDPARVGFVSGTAEERGKKFFPFDTALPGNGNFWPRGPRIRDRLECRGKGRNRGIPKNLLITGDRMATSTKRKFLIILLLLLAVGAFGGWFSWYKFFREVDQPPFANESERFKYGSIGAEAARGLPYWIWVVMPRIFPDLVPGPGGYKSFGLVWEEGKELPSGFSKKIVGFPRVANNCAICHTGTWRARADETPHVVAGAPSHTSDVQSILRFLYRAGKDPRFNSKTILRRN
jgi:mono/diheme cytochrome c family protein